VTGVQTAALGYAVISRLAYVLYVGIALRRETEGGPERFRRFRRTAAWIMNHDAFAFVVLCLLSAGTLTLPLSRPVVIAIGIVLTLVGLGVKLWAARTLGADAYYWHNFFEPDAAQGLVMHGPYRFVSNPMYTIGYLHTYGFALVLGSLPGVFAAAFAQAAILTFYYLVEKPHFEELHRLS
jgi:protein-S-isoprenylcysteine O-methyltransferase Ste14